MSIFCGLPIQRRSHSKRSKSPAEPRPSAAHPYPPARSPLRHKSERLPRGQRLSDLGRSVSAGPAVAGRFRERSPDVVEKPLPPVPLGRSSRSIADYVYSSIPPAADLSAATRSRERIGASYEETERTLGTASHISAELAPPRDPANILNAVVQGIARCSSPLFAW
ncbi:hypothetical protein DL768_011255 [Monosporascus sp. mg162]|nr:hypothetical protein DL768_011255 [Monosporascus sp. mg162]